MAKKPNLLFFGIDSLCADHMSLYGYERLTTPNITKYAEQGVAFSKCYSPSIPTTSGYSCMLTGMDCFGTDVVALRHKSHNGAIVPGVKTLAEVLGENGYSTTCIGFGGNPASRGFQKYIEYSGWGSWSDGRSLKAEKLNEVAIPELTRLASEEQPFFLFMRHMDPHSPYLPPAPFERMFYGKNEFDENNKSLEAVYKFKPFCDYFYSWFPPGCTDADYIIAQYDAEIAYMDACIQNVLSTLEALKIEDETLVVFTSDHGETLNDHDCYFDHHGLYDCTLHVPFVLRYKGKIPEGKQLNDFCQLQDVMPTILDILNIKTDINFYGRDLIPLINGKSIEQKPEFYITECTWERKHGWRTPQWKLIVALEPDFHYKPTIELYNLIQDPGENNNVANENPEVVEMLTKRMEKHIAARESVTKRKNPMITNENWYAEGVSPFKTSDDAYNTMHIGNAESAKKLQAALAEKKNKE